MPKFCNLSLSIYLSPGLTPYLAPSCPIVASMRCASIVEIRTRAVAILYNQKIEAGLHCQPDRNLLMRYVGVNVVYKIGDRTNGWEISSGKTHNEACILVELAVRVQRLVI